MMMVISTEAEDGIFQDILGAPVIGLHSSQLCE